MRKIRAQPSMVFPSKAREGKRRRGKAGSCPRSKVDFYFPDLLRLRNISATPVIPAPITAAQGASFATAATRVANRPDGGGGRRGRNNNLATAQKKGGSSST